MKWILGLGLSLAVIVVGFSLPVRADESAAAEHFARGSQLLAAADFEGALVALGQAMKADPEDLEYRNQYALLRRVIKVRRDFAAEGDPIRRQQMSAALRAYYYGHALYKEALALDRENHRRATSPASAVLLAESLLQVGEDAAAVELLEDQDLDQLGLQGRLFLGIALARENRLERAQALARSITLPTEASPELLYHMARLRALIEDYTHSLALLTQTLERIPSSRSDELRERIKACRDFHELSGETRFATMLSTQSKQAESACSSGKNCGACPSRRTCGSQSVYDE